MKTPRYLQILLAILFFAGLGSVACFTLTGCQHTVKLEAGGVYTFPVLASLDQKIIAADNALGDSVKWYNANSTFLAQWPQIGTAAANVASHRDGWIKDAWAARDAYAQAYAAYQTGAGTATAADDKLKIFNGVIAALADVTTQISNYQSAHPHA